MYVGHQRPTSGTTIVDVLTIETEHLATIDVPDGWHSHKVRVSKCATIVNHERFGNRFGGGLGIYDVSKPSSPKLITKWMTNSTASISTAAMTPISRPLRKVTSAT